MQALVPVAEEGGRQDGALLPAWFSPASGKLEGQALATATRGLPLFRVAAQAGASTLHFIVDTGAGVSLVPQDVVKGAILQPTAVRITTASGAPLPTHGEVLLPLFPSDPPARPVTHVLILAQAQ